VKLDGYLALLLKHKGHLQIRSRKNNDLTATYPSVVAAALDLKADYIPRDVPSSRRAESKGATPAVC